MNKNNEDKIKKIFGRSANDIFNHTYKSITWRELKSKDNSKGLIGNMQVASLEEAATKAKLITTKLKEFGRTTNEESYISFFSRDLSIILYGASKTNFTDNDWNMVHELSVLLDSKL